MLGFLIYGPLEYQLRLHVTPFENKKCIFPITIQTNNSLQMSLEYVTLDKRRLSKSRKIVNF